MLIARNMSIRTLLNFFKKDILILLVLALHHYFVPHCFANPTQPFGLWSGVSLLKFISLAVGFR